MKIILLISVLIFFASCAPDSSSTSAPPASTKVGASSGSGKVLLASGTLKEEESTAEIDISSYTHILFAVSQGEISCKFPSWRPGGPYTSTVLAHYKLAKNAPWYKMICDNFTCSTHATAGSASPSLKKQGDFFKISVRNVHHDGYYKECQGNVKYEVYGSKLSMVLRFTDHRIILRYF